MGEILLGVDAGTSTIKAVAFSLDGEALTRRSRPTELLSPTAGWAEQDMTETWNRTAAVIREVTEAVDGTVAAVGVTGQGGGAWLLDSDGDPVRNAIRWTDGRSADFVREWHDGTAFETVFETCGYALSTGSPFGPYRWLCEDEPQSVERTETALFCKDWIRYRLTGERGTDYSDASLTHFRPDRGTFADDVAALLGVTLLADRVPAPSSGTDVVGAVTPAAAEATGLPPGTPVVAGVMDVVASAFGSGATAGECTSIVGTTLQNQVVTPRPTITPPPAGYTLHVGVDGLGLRAMGAMSGTPNLDWAAETLFDGASISAVESWAKAAPVGSDGVMYHPYLSGEKAPFVEPAARAQFTGLRPDHTRNHLARAVYEGVALSMRDCYEHLPAETERVALSGGGAQSAFWCQLFADCLDAAVVVPEGTEFGAKGAALLAGLGTGHYADLESAIDRTVSTGRTFTPDPSAVETYGELYDLFVETREQLRPVWQSRAASFDGE